tara:strand:+ start:838 stop:1272 length:435 start_codon:yes stop_codon:yes gene_type:complete
MIKTITILIIANFFLFGNEKDSLFWFDVNDIDDEMPYFPLIINKVFTGGHLSVIDSMEKAKQTELEVYRIQIFESSVASIARAEARRFQNILGDTVYINFETPLYKLRIGNYYNRKNAEDAIESISKLGARDAWIIRTKKNIRN